jgi:hypothetical protein
MIDRFKFVQVNSIAELDRYGVREFAAEFGHEPIGLPIWLFFHKDDLVAYCEIRMTPVIYPAVHPKISPRAFFEGGRLLCDKMRDHLPGAFVIYGSAPFDAKQMTKLGFELSPLQFFQPKETENGS